MSAQDRPMSYAEQVDLLNSQLAGGFLFFLFFAPPPILLFRYEIFLYKTSRELTFGKFYQLIARGKEQSTRTSQLGAPLSMSMSQPGLMSMSQQPPASGGSTVPPGM